MNLQSSVDIPFICRLSDLHLSDRLSSKYAVKRYLFVKIFFAVVFAINAVICFYGYYIQRVVEHVVIADMVSQLILGVFMLTFPPFCIIVTELMRKHRIGKNYLNNKYRGATRMLHADSSGICICTGTHARLYGWEDVSRIVECAHGFIFVCGRSRCFLPARFLDAQKLGALRNFIIENAREKTVFVEQVKLPQQTEQCPEFFMAPLRGQPLHKVTLEEISFKKYFKMMFATIWQTHMELLLAIIFIFFFLLTYIIFSASSIFTGLLLILLVGAMLYGVIFVLSYVYISACYECDFMCKSKVEYSFYRDCVYVEASGQKSVMDYDSVIIFRERQNSVILMNEDVNIMITSDDTEELEQIKDLLKLKTTLR